MIKSSVNKNKFTFGYDIESMNDNNNDKYIKLGFIGGSYPKTHILSLHSDNVALNEAYINICKLVESLVFKSGLKPFLAAPKNKKWRKNKKLRRHQL